MDEQPGESSVEIEHIEPRHPTAEPQFWCYDNINLGDPALLDYYVADPTDQESSTQSESETPSKPAAPTDRSWLHPVEPLAHRNREGLRIVEDVCGIHWSIPHEWDLNDPNTWSNEFAYAMAITQCQRERAECEDSEVDEIDERLEAARLDRRRRLRQERHAQRLDRAERRATDPSWQATRKRPRPCSRFRPRPKRTFAEPRDKNVSVRPWEEKQTRVVGYLKGAPDLNNLQRDYPLDERFHAPHYGPPSSVRPARAVISKEEEIMPYNKALRWTKDDIPYRLTGKVNLKSKDVREGRRAPWAPRYYEPETFGTPPLRMLKLPDLERIVYVKTPAECDRAVKAIKEDLKYMGLMAIDLDGFHPATCMDMRATALMAIYVPQFDNDEYAPLYSSPRYYVFDMFELTGFHPAALPLSLRTLLTKDMKEENWFALSCGAINDVLRFLDGFMLLIENWVDITKFSLTPIWMTSKDTGRYCVKSTLGQADCFQAYRPDYYYLNKRVVLDEDRKGCTFPIPFGNTQYTQAERDAAEEAVQFICLDCFMCAVVVVAHYHETLWAHRMEIVGLSLCHSYLRKWRIETFQGWADGLTARVSRLRMRTIRKIREAESEIRTKWTHRMTRQFYDYHYPNVDMRAHVEHPDNIELLKRKNAELGFEETDEQFLGTAKPITKWWLTGNVTVQGEGNSSREEESTPATVGLGSSKKTTTPIPLETRVPPSSSKRLKNVSLQDETGVPSASREPPQKPPTTESGNIFESLAYSSPVRTGTMEVLPTSARSVGRGQRTPSASSEPWPGVSPMEAPAPLVDTALGFDPNSDDFITAPKSKTMATVPLSRYVPISESSTVPAPASTSHFPPIIPFQPPSQLWSSTYQSAAALPVAGAGLFGSPPSFQPPLLRPLYSSLPATTAASVNPPVALASTVETQLRDLQTQMLNLQQAQMQQARYEQERRVVAEQNQVLIGQLNALTQHNLQQAQELVALREREENLARANTLMRQLQEHAPIVLEYLMYTGLTDAELRQEVNNRVGRTEPCPPTKTQAFESDADRAMFQLVSALTRKLSPPSLFLAVWNAQLDLRSMLSQLETQDLARTFEIMREVGVPEDIWRHEKILANAARHSSAVPMAPLLSTIPKPTALPRVSPATTPTDQPTVSMELDRAPEPATTRAKPTPMAAATSAATTAQDKRPSASSLPKPAPDLATRLAMSQAAGYGMGLRVKTDRNQKSAVAERTVETVFIPPGHLPARRRLRTRGPDPEVFDVTGRQGDHQVRVREQQTLGCTKRVMR